MPEITKKKVAIERRRNLVMEYYLKSWTQAEIARKLGVSQGTVSNDIKAVREEWKESRISDFDDLVIIVDKMLETIRREAWRGWERSQEDQETTKVVDNGADRKAEKTIRQNTGDPRFLEVIRKTLEDRRQLMALDAPPRTESDISDAQQWARENALGRLLSQIRERTSGPPSNVIDDSVIHAPLKEDEIPKKKPERKKRPK